MTILERKRITDIQRLISRNTNENGVVSYDDMSSDREVSDSFLTIWDMVSKDFKHISFEDFKDQTYEQLVGTSMIMTGKTDPELLDAILTYQKERANG